ncbi:MAG: PAS domain-containing sensor histidine kinase [Rhodopseudomonas palustris]|nr:MAG: PAS domain-containing sensor histidine kinase [Rhodopseudomonas palustris]
MSLVTSPDGGRRSLSIWPTFFAHRWSIRRRLAATVLVTALPLTVLLVTAISEMAIEATETQRIGLLYTARALAAAVDARIDKHIALGRTLATSPALLDDNLNAFKSDAQRAFVEIDDTAVVVADLEGQLLINPFAESDQPLPKRPPAAFAAQRLAFAQNKIVVSDLFRAPLKNGLFATIEFPIWKDGRAFRALAVPMVANGFSGLLNAQSMPEDWHASINDSQGTIVTRFPSPERAGSLASKSHRQFLGQNGIFEYVSLDGDPTIGASVRTANGWTANVAIKRSAMYAEVWHDVRWVSLTACVVLFLSILTAFRIARGISEPILALSNVNSSEGQDLASLKVVSLPEAAAVAQQLVATTDQLRRSETRLRLALDAAEAGTWEANATLGTYNASDRALTLTGFSPGTHLTIERALSNLLPEDQKLLEGLVVETFRTGKPFSAEVRSKRLDGSIRWLSKRGALRNGPDGPCLIGLVQDVSERRRAEEALRENEARLATVFEILPIGVGMFDEHGTLILANSAIRQFLPAGVIPSRDDEVRRRHWRTSNSDRQPVQPSDFPCERALHGDRVVPGVEVVYTDDDGHEIWLNVTSAPMRNSHGCVYAGVSSVTDITKQKLLEKRLAEQNRELEARVEERTAQLQREMKLREDTQAQLAQSQRLDSLGKLTGGIAHDFNNLLTVIIGNLELAEAEAKNENVTLLIHQAMAAAERSASINRRLLSFARRQTLAPQRINLNDRVVEMHQLLRPSLGEKITLATQVEPELWPTLTDPGEIDSAVINIAINGRDAMPAGGVLTITTRNLSVDNAMADRFDVRPGDYASITVSDTGHGMTPEVLGRAFEPFFTTKEAGKGSGLGLSSVYGFVHQSGGFLDIDSKIGQGTTISLYLPRAPADASATSNAEDCSDVHARSDEAILVVEDNDSVRKIACMNLESLGYRVLEAVNGVEAKAIIATAKEIKLVFSDVSMPGGISGYDLAKWIQDETPHLKVLLASGHNDLPVDDELRSSIRLLSKPYKRSQLAHALRELIN